MFKVLLIILLTATTMQGADIDKLITEANELFEMGNEMALKDPDASKKLYRKASLKYRDIVKQGIENPHLYKNLGNAWYMAGDKGRALLSYHRARKLSPTDHDINHNIEFVRSTTVDEAPGSGESFVSKFLLFWHGWSFNLRLAIFTIANIIVWSLLALNLYKRNRKIIWVVLVMLIPSMIFGASSAATVFQLDSHVDGVITEREVTPRQGNGYIYEMAFSGPLHSGCEFQLLEKRKNWYRIELPGGAKCWIPARTATMIDEDF